MRTYCNKKFNWKKDECNWIDWNPLGRALTNLNFKQRINITKFIHGWLGVNKRCHDYDDSVPIACGSCGHHCETQTHFLWCESTPRIAHRISLQRSLSAWLDRRTDPVVADLLMTGLFQWAKDPTLIKLPPILSPEIAAAVKEQTAIGWDQLWFGRLSSRWSDIHATRRTDLHLESGAPLGQESELWVQQFIKFVWIGVLTMWKTRNDYQHEADKNDPTTTTRLKHQIDALYLAADLLPAVDRIPFQQPKEKILRLTIEHQKNWIEIHQEFFHHQNKRAAIQAQLGVQGIRSYFTSLPSTDDKPP
jgi:hypothetical protein